MPPQAPLTATADGSTLPLERLVVATYSGAERGCGHGARVSSRSRCSLTTRHRQEAGVVAVLAACAEWPARPRGGGTGLH